VTQRPGPEREADAGAPAGEPEPAVARGRRGADRPVRRPSPRPPGPVRVRPGRRPR